LTLIDEAINIPSQGYGGAMSVEFYRLKGELLLAQSPGDPREAEVWLLRALEVAQVEQATMLELHAAISLSRIWRAQGKVGEIRQVLSEIYERFSEGFATADLIDARTLLEELSR
jgi:predicted ATPase